MIPLGWHHRIGRITWVNAGQTAQDQPFKELGQVVKLFGDQCDFHRRDKEAEVQ